VQKLVWSIIREEPRLLVKGILPPSGNRDSYIYMIQDWDGATWKYERSSGIALGPVSIGPMKGEASSYDEARAIIDEDWENITRLRAWIEFMLNNEPPKK
jgi:hypothetical protein